MSFDVRNHGGRRRGQTANVKAPNSNVSREAPVVDVAQAHAYKGSGERDYALTVLERRLARDLGSTGFAKALACFR
jgi:hypothetical protein